MLVRTRILEFRGLLSHYVEAGRVVCMSPASNCSATHKEGGNDGDLPARIVRRNLNEAEGGGKGSDSRDNHFYPSGITELDFIVEA